MLKAALRRARPRPPPGPAPGRSGPPQPATDRTTVSGFFGGGMALAARFPAIGSEKRAGHLAHHPPHLGRKDASAAGRAGGAARRRFAEKLRVAARNAANGQPLGYPGASRRVPRNPTRTAGCRAGAVAGLATAPGSAWATAAASTTSCWPSADPLFRASA